MIYGTVIMVTYPSRRDIRDVFLIYAYHNDTGSHFQLDVMFALIDVERGQSPTFQTAAMVRQAGARINVLMGNYANVLGKA